MRATWLLLPLLLALGLALPIGLGCGQVAPARSTGPVEISLPLPTTDGAMSLERALSLRRSVRRFAPEPLTLAQIGQLAWAAQGITEPNRGFRTAPSAGALYPLELYLLTPDGVFHYLPQGHKLVQLSDRDLREDLSAAALGQGCVSGAPLDIVITGIYERTAAKYGPRSELYVHLEAGHVAQNLHLQAVALGLGSVPVGAFDEAAVQRLLDLSANQTPLYIIPIGHPA